MKTLFSLIEIKEISLILFGFLELKFSFGISFVGKDTSKKPIVKETPKEVPQQQAQQSNNQKKREVARLESNNNTSNN